MRRRPIYVLPLGIAIGTGIGVALNNLPVGIGVGVALGFAMGGIIQRRSKEK
jgi:F0F1-type ATP synthase membrane subunit c/vacuolar-type H+-ATPase subunit K